MVEPVPARHLKEREVYLIRAQQARAEADAATLDNVRDRCLRAEAAWMEMAMWTGIRMVRAWSAIERVIACRIHQVA